MVRAARVVLVSGAIAGVVFAGCGWPTVSDVAVGTLEVVEVDVGPLQPAQALQVLVQEGDVVHAGDTLVLFTMPTLASASAQAYARAAATREASRELSRGARPGDISRAAAELRVTTTAAEGWRATDSDLVLRSHRRDRVTGRVHTARGAHRCRSG